MVGAGGEEGHGGREMVDGELLSKAGKLSGASRRPVLRQALSSPPMDISQHSSRNLPLCFLNNAQVHIRASATLTTRLDAA